VAEDSMSEFINFVALNANNEEMGKKFLSIMSEKQINKIKLRKWFINEGYNISLDECQELLINRDNIINHINQVKGY
jgi:hypothetical protein